EAQATSRAVVALQLGRSERERPKFRGISALATLCHVTVEGYYRTRQGEWGKRESAGFRDLPVGECRELSRRALGHYRRDEPQGEEQPHLPGPVSARALGPRRKRHLELVSR